LATVQSDFIRNACFVGDGGGEQADNGRLLNAGIPEKQQGKMNDNFSA